MSFRIGSSLSLWIISNAALATGAYCEATYNEVTGALSLPCLEVLDLEGMTNAYQAQLQQSPTEGLRFDIARFVSTIPCTAQLDRADNRLTVPCLRLSSETSGQQSYSARAEAAILDDGSVELTGVELLPDLSADEYERKVALGRKLFFDTNLSDPPGQSCASCHDPEHAFTDPDTEVPTSAGVLPGRFGSRNTPSASYAAFSPPFYYDAAEGLYIGGQFLDGRAATLEEQAQKPLLNELEMANPDQNTVVQKVRNADYAPDFTAVYGEDAFADTDRAYASIADAIASFERSAEVSPFSSKFDAYLAGKAQLTEQELLGRELFDSELKGNCAACHPSTSPDGVTPPLFTDFTYDNLGVPKAPDNPFYSLPSELNPQGADFIDLGLGGQPGAAPPSANFGKFKVPSLRNIALTPPYMHNGVFKTLHEVVEFYSTRDTDPQRWGAPEVSVNVNRDELGDLGLTGEEVDALVAFMETLSDGYTP